MAQNRPDCNTALLLPQFAFDIQQGEIESLQCCNVIYRAGAPIFTRRVDIYPGGGGALNFFSGRGVRPGFPKWGACELTFASEKGGL